jgi:hypothetical protein
MQFYELSFTLNNKKFKFIPIKYYYINQQLPEPRPIDTRRVVMYSFEYSSDTDCIKAEIPYYISDGNTNHYRANMLYPFLCFNHKSSYSCPYTTNVLSDAGLIKLNIARNFDTSLIDEWILYNIRRKGYEKELIDFLVLTSDGKRTGVLSVLPRITNILDFLIAISSDPIIQWQKTIISEKPYRPIFDMTSKYDMNVINEPISRGEKEKFGTYRYKYGNNDDNATFRKFMLITDYYRNKLTVALNDQIKNYIKYGILSMTPKQLEPNNINLTDFNDLLGICNNSKISQNSEQNVEKYSYISSMFYNELLNIVQSKNKSSLIDPNEAHFFTTLHTMLTKNNLYRENPIIDNTMKLWNARCRKKYLKYKNKYLQLKNEMK